MVYEYNIKSLNFGQTLVANSVEIIYWILCIYIVIQGLNIIGNIQEPILKSFTLNMFIYFTLTKLRLKFVLVYNSKDGGLIRVD